MPGPSNRKGRCAVCSHVDRGRIDAMRGAGVSFDALAARFGVPKSTLFRHWSEHVPPETKAAFKVGPTTLEQARERAAAEGGAVVDYFGIVRSVLVDQLLKQSEANSAQGVATVAGRLVEVLNALGKISGEIVRDTASVNVNVAVGVAAAPGFDVLRAGLLDLARAHPAARPDIVALLRRVEGGAPPPPPLTIEHRPNA